MADDDESSALYNRFRDILHEEPSAEEALREYHLCQTREAILRQAAKDRREAVEQGIRELCRRPRSGKDS
ncbi:hypothetical protein [Oricola sp.]|uniref:hypothetical protein n=1 Tax=Oricola sp. TaxID=1979950 RepID=UPI003513A596